MAKAVSITAPPYGEEVYYSDADLDGSAAITFTYTASITAPTVAADIMWFSSLSSSDKSSVNWISTLYALEERIAGSRTLTYPTDGISDADLLTHAMANSATTLYPEATGLTWTNSWYLSDGDVGGKRVWAAAWDGADTWVDISSSTSTLTSTTGQILMLPSYINIDRLSSGAPLWDDYRITAGTSLTLSAVTSENFDGTCPNMVGGVADTEGSGVNWYVSAADVNGTSLAKTVLATCDTVATYTFPNADNIYTVWATGSADDTVAGQEVEGSINISTYANPGRCIPKTPGYIDNDRELVDPALGSNAISMGNLAGRDDRSINLYVDYVLSGYGLGTTFGGKGIFVNEDNSSLSARRDTAITTGTYTSALSNDADGGLRFSEFIGAQDISAEVTFVSETVDRYGYWSQSNGIITVIVNCNTSKNSTFTVSVAGYSTPASITRVLASGPDNEFIFSGLNTRNQGGTATATYKITVRDDETNKVKETDLPNPSSSGATVKTSIGGVFN